MPRDPDDPIAADAPQSRRLTPSIGSFEEARQQEPGSLPPQSDVPSDTANEDFLFHLYRGSELLQDNRVDEAKDELERALHLQPRDTKGQDLLAVVYFRLGHYPRAIAIYEQLRRKNARDTAILLNLALCYLKTGQPALARRDLEQLLSVNPTHSRAWGYLGLACERLGDLEQAQRAFAQGGHHQMAKRMAERLGAGTGAGLSADAAPAAADVGAGQDVRDVATAAFEELDAGELSFELAAPASDKSASNDHEWRAVELGAPSSPKRSFTPSLPLSKADSGKPDTKDGPPPSNPRIPHLAAPPSLGRTPTLIAPAPPAANAAEHGVTAVRFPSPRPPAFALDDAGATAPPVPSIRRPVVAVPPVRTTTATQTSLHHLPPSERSKTLPPPDNLRPASVPPPAGQLARESAAGFPSTGSVTIHPSGVALIRTGKAGFATRLEAMRVSSNGVAMRLLERQAKGKPTGESFGGVGSPMAHVAEDAQLMLAARAGRKLSSFSLEDEMCFVREEVLLGFDAALTYENGRLATGEGEFVAVVQLRGKGAVLVEAIGEAISLEVAGNRGLSVRREVIIGWFGRMVPRALGASEAPCGQRGLVSFAGEGRVLVSGG